MMKEMRRVREREGGEIERERWGHRVREMRGDERERHRERFRASALGRFNSYARMHICKRSWELNYI